MVGKNSDLKKLWKSILILGLFFLFIPTILLGQQGIPTFTAEDLNGQKVNIPNDMIDKKSLIGFAFTPKNQDQLATWIQPVYDELLDTNSLASMVYDVNVVLVVCFNKTNVKFKKRVLRGIA